MPQITPKHSGRLSSPWALPLRVEKRVKTPLPTAQRVADATKGGELKFELPPLGGNPVILNFRKESVFIRLSVRLSHRSLLTSGLTHAKVHLFLIPSPLVFDPRAVMTTVNYHSNVRPGSNPPPRGRVFVGFSHFSEEVQ